MTPIRTSRLAPVAAEMGFRGVLESAYLLRFLLQQKSNLETRAAMARLFGRHWGNAGQEKQYFELLSSYVLAHHQKDFFAYMRQEKLNQKSDDVRLVRQHIVQYLTQKQGLQGTSEVVNDIP